MAIRDLLAISRVGEFGRWLEKEKGYRLLEHNVVSCEVLRAVLENEDECDIVVLYKRHNAKMHVTVQDKDYRLVREFLSFTKEKSKAWERRKGELFGEMLDYINEVVNNDIEFLRVLFRLGFKLEEIIKVCEFDEDEMTPVELCTFAEDDSDYCRDFVVPKGWLLEKLEFMDSCNENKGVDLEKFLDEYVWDETWAIYEAAKAEGKLLFEEVQK